MFGVAAGWPSMAFSFSATSTLPGNDRDCTAGAEVLLAAGAATFERLVATAEVPLVAVAAGMLTGVGTAVAALVIVALLEREGFVEVDGAVVAALASDKALGAGT